MQRSTWIHILVKTSLPLPYFFLFQVTSLFCIELSFQDLVTLNILKNEIARIYMF